MNVAIVLCYTSCVHRDVLYYIETRNMILDEVLILGFVGNVHFAIGFLT